MKILYVEGLINILQERYHNIIKLASCVQLPWLQIQFEALGFRHLEALFLNLLQDPWTQLINLVMLYITPIPYMQ